MRTVLLIGCAGVLGIIAASSAGCTALLSLDGATCSQNSDCSAGQICNLTTKVCVNASTPQVVSPGDDAGGTPKVEVCETTNDCIAIHGDKDSDPWVCRQDLKQCRPLLSAECTEVLGGQPPSFGGLGWKDPNAVFIGVTLPLGGGLGDPELGKLTKTLRNGVKLALDHIADGGHLPGEGGVKRPLLGVVCDEWDLGVGLPGRVARHLVDNVAVQAIVSMDDGNTRAMWSQGRLKEAGVTNLCVQCGGSEWKTFDDGGLQFTLLPPFAAEIPVGVKLTEQLEVQVRAENGMAPGDKIRLALIGPQQAGGIETLAEYKAKLKFNGVGTAENGANYKEIFYAQEVAINEYVDPVPIANAVKAFKPHIIVYPGDIEMTRQVMPFIEASIEPGQVRPKYVSSFAALAGGSEMIAGNEDFRKRFYGTMPAPSAEFAVGFLELDAIYVDTFHSQPTGFYHLLYDGLFGTALAIVAAGNPAGGIKGSHIAQGYMKLQSPNADAVINVGPTELRIGAARLREGNTLSLKGRIVDFDFDQTTGTQTGYTAPWCISKDSQGNNYFYIAGGIPGNMKYSVKTGTFVRDNVFVCP